MINLLSLVGLVIKIIIQVAEIYSFVLVAYALMSWFPGAYDTTIGQWIIKLARPYLNLFRRLNLSFGMIDFTILVAIIALNLSTQALQLIYIKLVELLLY